jgi:hypothetical protein
MSNNKVDEVNNPPWYESEGGVKCIEITRHMNSNLGHVIRYVWRAGKKGEGVEFAIKDLNKAMVYLKDEIQRLKDNEAKNKKAEEIKEVSSENEICYERLKIIYNDINDLQKQKLYFMSIDAEFTTDPTMLKSDAIKRLDEKLYKLESEAITEHKKINKIYNRLLYKQKIALTQSML